MPITGPLRAVDTKVLGIDLETTKVYGSALDRYVFAAIDTGHGVPTDVIEFIEGAGGDVTKTSADEIDETFVTTLRDEKKSFDALLIYSRAERVSQSGSAISAALDQVSAAVEAAARLGGRVAIILDLPKPETTF